MNPWLLLLLAYAAAAAAFTLLFYVARRLNNFGIVDIAWALGFGPVALIYAWNGSGAATRRIAIATMAGLWSARLGGYLARRVLGHHPVEDGRYQQLRRAWGEQLHPKMFCFFQTQAALLVLLSVPFLLAAQNAAPGWHPRELLGLVLWLLALGGEALADAQLARFKRDPRQRGRVCDVGLWRLSRHPNYFFEWLVWVAFALFASASPWGWVSAYCPALMLFFLLKVTGIRYTEDQLLRSKGEAFRKYQQRTTAFVPWFPKDPS
jgi:steroid 5-alpha reductase family enzyme